MNSYMKFARLMDRILAVAGIALAIWLTWRDWPNPTFWTWLAIVMAILAVPLALFDWMGWIRTNVTSRFVRIRR